MSRILIFGGTGSLGRKLIDRFLPTSEVIACSRDEAKHWTLAQSYSDHPQKERLRFIVGDIRDKKRVSDVIRQTNAETIIIAAALKQVDTCERSPGESILTNLIGTQNVVEAVIEATEKSAKRRTVLFVSTDKACAPVNVYGMCKAISERLVTSQAADISLYGTRFIAVRYGNVLESRGSIIPLFKYQAESASALTVTDPDMTRFVMTLDESVDLIQHALSNAASGDIWIPRLPAMRIGDLADIFAKKSGKSINIVGLRPGEKMHESLVNESESIRTYEHDKHYVIRPAFETGTQKPFEYSSSGDVMTKEQLFDRLTKLDILDRNLSEFKGRAIEEIVK